MMLEMSSFTIYFFLYIYTRKYVYVLMNKGLGYWFHVRLGVHKGFLMIDFDEVPASPTTLSTSGDLYIGEWLDGLRSGQGTLTKAMRGKH